MIMSVLQEVKLYAYALDRKKTCSQAKCTATVIELRFFMKKKKMKMKKMKNL